MYFKIIRDYTDLNLFIYLFLHCHSNVVELSQTLNLVSMSMFKKMEALTLGVRHWLVEIEGRRYKKLEAMGIGQIEKISRETDKKLQTEQGKWKRRASDEIEFEEYDPRKEGLLL